MKKSNKEDAVSPVIGVMLMLVVTIIIAAVVMTFASDTTADIETAPIAVLDVAIYENINSNDGGMFYSHPSFQILYLAGDGKLDTSKMSIVSTWRGNDDETHTYTASGKLPNLLLRTNDNMGSTTGTGENEFGIATFKAGESFATNVEWGAMMTGEPTPIEDYTYFEEIFGPAYDTIEKGTEISISITHGKYLLYDEVVIVK